MKPIQEREHFIHDIIRVRDTRRGYLLPVRDALWAPARMDVLLASRRRCRRWRHSQKSD